MTVTLKPRRAPSASVGLSTKTWVRALKCALSFAYWFVGQAVGACLHLLLMVFIMYSVLYYYLTLFSYTPCIHKGNPRKGVPYICPSVCVFILHVS